MNTTDPVPAAAHLGLVDGLDLLPVDPHLHLVLLAELLERVPEAGLVLDLQLAVQLRDLLRLLTAGLRQLLLVHLTNSGRSVTDTGH